jgi:hypothetical protein
VSDVAIQKIVESVSLAVIILGVAGIVAWAYVRGQ